MIQEIKEIWSQIRQNRLASDAISARPLPVSGLDQNDVLLCITQDSNAGLLLRSQVVVRPAKTGCGRLIVRREQLLRGSNRTITSGSNVWNQTLRLPSHCWPARLSVILHPVRQPPRRAWKQFANSVACFLKVAAFFLLKKRSLV